MQLARLPRTKGDVPTLDCLCALHPLFSHDHAWLGRVGRGLGKGAKGHPYGSCYLRGCAPSTTTPQAGVNPAV